MEITQPEFEAGVLRAGLSREQAKLIWEQLQNRTEVEGRFEPAHVFGSIGVFTYLCNQAYTYFRNSIAFPFVLSGMGVLLIFGAMKFKKNEKKIQERVSEWLSREPAIAEH